MGRDIQNRSLVGRQPPSNGGNGGEAGGTGATGATGASGTGATGAGGTGAGTGDPSTGSGTGSGNGNGGESLTHLHLLPLRHPPLPLREFGESSILVQFGFSPTTRVTSSVSTPSTPSTPPPTSTGNGSSVSPGSSAPTSASSPTNAPGQSTNPPSNGGSSTSSSSNTPSPTPSAPTPPPGVQSVSSFTVITTQGPSGARSTVTAFLPPSPTPVNPARENAKQSGFFNNTSAVAGVFAVVGVLALILAFFIVTTCLRRRRARRFDREVAEAAAAAANTSLHPYEDDEDGGLGRIGYGGGVGGGGGGGAAAAAGYDTPHRDISKSSGHGSLRGDPVGFTDSYNMSELAGGGVAGVGAGLAAGAAGYGAYRSGGGAGGHPQYQPQSYDAAYNQQQPYGQQQPFNKQQQQQGDNYYDYSHPDGGYGAALYARSPPPGTQPYSGYLQQHPQGGYVYDPSSAPSQPQGQQTQGLQRQPTYPGLAHSPAPSGTTAVSDPYAAIAAVTSTANTSPNTNPAASLNRRSPLLPNPYDGANAQPPQNANPAVDAYGGYASNAYIGQQGFNAFGGQNQNPSSQHQPSQGQFQPYNDNAPLTTAFGAGAPHPDDDQEHNIAYDNSGHDHSAEDDNGSIADEDYGSRRVLKVANE